MRRSLRIAVGALFGGALAFFFGTERGRRLRAQAERQVLPHLKETGVWVMDEITGNDSTPADEQPLNERIDAVRQKLKEQKPE